MPGERPNVLLVQSDEHSFRCLSHLERDGPGEPVQTPALDELASTGTNFQQTYCQVPLCGPSRDCMLRSRDQQTTGSWINEDAPDPTLETFPETFSNAGYDTCLIGKMHFAGTSQFHGFDERPYGDLTGETGHQWEPIESPEFDHWTGAGVTEIPESQLQEYTVLRESLAWLRDQHQDADSPWLLTASLSRPHFPLTAPERYIQRYWDDGPTELLTEPKIGFEGDDTDHPNVQGGRDIVGVPDEETEQHARACYFACVDFLDDIVGELLATAARDGLLENTIVVYTSDHGELAGEHGLWWKNTWHEAASRVPLFVQTPAHRNGEQSGTVIDTPTSLADLYPTLCGLCDVEFPDGLEGTDLSDSVRTGREPERGPVITDNLFPIHGEGTEYRMVRDGQYKYVGFRDAPELLFDLEADPGETVNLASDATDEERAVLERLRSHVEQTVDFEAAAQAHRGFDFSVPDEIAFDGPTGSGNCYHLPDGRIVDADTPIYDPEVLIEEPESVYADWPDSE